ncbi:MAG: hypothetical protein ACJ789_05165 [Thermomicrobiales bacterium]
MIIDERLRRLEAILNPVGCDTCHWWRESTAVLADDFGHTTRPEVCPSCGRTVAIRNLVVLRAPINLDWI